MACDGVLQRPVPPDTTGPRVDGECARVSPRGRVAAVGTTPADGDAIADATKAVLPALPPPLVVSDEQARTYAASAFARVELRDVAAAEARVAASDGFGVAEDVLGKPGYIATEVGATATLRLPRLRDAAPVARSGRHQRKSAAAAAAAAAEAERRRGFIVVLGYLTSYEHMGCFRVVVAACGGGAPLARRASTASPRLASPSTRRRRSRARCRRDGGTATIEGEDAERLPRA